MERVICLVIGYVFGLLQTGYLYGKMKGIDIRKHGSGNAGSTNALRTMESLLFWGTVLNVWRQWLSYGFCFGLPMRISFRFFPFTQDLARCWGTIIRSI